MANIFAIAFSREENFFKAPLKENGYEAFTTFYSDLTLAELVSGLKGVKETIQNVTNNWLNDYKYFTEFVMAINYKSWEMSAQINHPDNFCYLTPQRQDLVKFYSQQFHTLQDKFRTHYKDNQEALDYYFKVTD